MVWAFSGDSTMISVRPSALREPERLRDALAGAFAAGTTSASAFVRLAARFAAGAFAAGTTSASAFVFLAARFVAGAFAVAVFVRLTVRFSVGSFVVAVVSSAAFVFLDAGFAAGFFVAGVFSTAASGPWAVRFSDAVLLAGLISTPSLAETGRAPAGAGC